MGDSNLTVVMLIVLLVPGIPAYILYSRLPSEKTIVTGPFQGFKVQLTGAFAAYFVLVMLAMGFMLTYLKGRRSWLPDEDYVTWMVRGNLQFEGDNPQGKLGDAIFTFSPRQMEVRSDGSFYTVVALPTGIPGSATTMQIEHPLYNTAVVHLTKNASPRGYGAPQTLEFDTGGHIINITDPIVLKTRATPYNPQTAYQPQLVTDSE